MKKYGDKNWKIISKNILTRSPVQCMHRWNKILKPELIKGPWTIEQDRKLLSWVKNDGPKNWSSCAQFIKGRSGKQCRERWYNTLNPNVKKGNWEPEEDYLLFKLFNEFGCKWSKINLFFIGRTENSVKNRFYSTLRRLFGDKKKLNQFNSENNEKKLKDTLLQYVPEAINEKTLKLIRKYYCVKETSEQENLKMTVIEELNYYKKYTYDLDKKIENFYLNEKKNYDNFSLFNNKDLLNKLNLSKQLEKHYENTSNHLILNEKIINESVIFKEQFSRENLHNINPTLTMIEQLNDLEELLKMTKKNLLEKLNKNTLKPALDNN